MLSLVLLGACSAQPETKRENSTEDPVVNSQDALLEEIESRIELPASAFELTDYARYYAIDNGRVVAVYTTHSPPDRENDSIPLGKRGWVDEGVDLPFTLDGGCSIVNVVYSLDSQSFNEVSCNGEA